MLIRCSHICGTFLGMIALFMLAISLAPAADGQVDLAAALKQKYRIQRSICRGLRPILEPYLRSRPTQISLLLRKRILSFRLQSAVENISERKLSDDPRWCLDKLDAVSKQLGSGQSWGNARARSALRFLGRACERT